MTTIEQFEQLSALIDGEVPDNEVAALIDQLQLSPEQQQTWHRYHMIAEVMRQCQPMLAHSDFSRKVKSRIASIKRADVNTIETPVTPIPRPRHKKVVNALSGLAVAASIIGGLFILLQSLIGPRQSSPASLEASIAPAATVRAKQPLCGDQSEGGAQLLRVSNRPSYLFKHAGQLAGPASVYVVRYLK